MMLREKGGDLQPFAGGQEAKQMDFKIEVEQEIDGRWIAEVMDIPGVMVYGEDRARAIAKAKALALRVLVDWVENEQQSDPFDSVTFAYA